MLVKLIVNVIKFAIVVSLAITIIAGLGLAPFLGCYLRYPSQDGTLATTATVTLYGNGMSSYNPLDINATTSNVTYGQWTKVDLSIKGGAALYFQAQGSVSLCKAYYPDTWTQEIPRVNDSTWFNLKLPAANSTYTLTQVFNGDLIKVKVGANSSSNSYTPYSSLYDPTNQNMYISPSQNCSDGQSAYDAMCGKYTYYQHLPYGTVCESISGVGSRWNVTSGGCGLCNKNTFDNTTGYINSGFACTEISRKSECGASANPTCRSANHTCYKISGTTTDKYFPYGSSVVFYEGDNKTISTLQLQSINSDYSCPNTSVTDPKSWFTFDLISNTKTQGGLQYSITNTSISNQTVSIIDNCSSTNNATGCHNFSEKYIFDNYSSGGMTSLTQNYGYLTYSFLSKPVYTDYSGGQHYGDYTGGYVLSIQQTKCYRVNGAYSSDSVYTNRGSVRYLLLDTGIDPNANTSMSASGIGTMINFIAGDSSAQSITADRDGVLWLRIDNKSSDYTSSNGSYQVIVSQSAPVSVATSFDLWPWMNGIFSNAFGNLTTKLFQNLTCYGATDKSSCFNLFQVIRALLVAYIMIFAIFFLIGMVKVDYYDFIQRIIKITIVGGLISGKTFDFFNNYIFNIIFGFTDSLMNSAVFFPTTDGSSGLGAFTKAIFATLGQDIFQIQLLAMLGTGFTGIVMIVLILISLVVFLIPILNLMVVTLVSYFFVQVLLGMAPIFLIFILFKPTQHIFKQWVTYIIAYLFEPVMLFMGIAILAKLFMIYLDYVLGYSVCYKCNAAFSIPFLTSFFPVLDVLLNQMPVFCLYWLSPWGYDTMSFNYGQALTNIIALFSIANATYYYTSMCGQLVTQIFGVSTAGSQIAESMTKSAMQKAAQAAKKGAEMAKKAKGGAAGGGAGGK